MNLPTEQKEQKETGLAINKALFDKDSEKLIRLISDYMQKHNMKASQEIVQMIPVEAQ